jgi:hypothetical protein
MYLEVLTADDRYCSDVENTLITDKLGAVKSDLTNNAVVRQPNLSSFARAVLTLQLL